MTIQQGLVTSFKVQMLQAQQNLPADALYMALYTVAADIGPNTTVYSTDGEVVGTGYTAGGELLLNVTVQSTGTTAFVNFDNPTWANASFTARGALIYNATQGTSAIAVLDFGADKTCNSSNFTVTLPANSATTALIRFP